MNDIPGVASERHAITRIRRDVQRRTITVKRVARLTPHMVRVTFAGADLAGFASPGFDDHVKLFWDDVGRHYTPRSYDAATGELDIDFALHDAAGPATAWAARAKAGDALALGGPRNSFMVPDDFDWYLFAGDETALPAIARRLEALRSDARAIVVAEVEGSGEEIMLRSGAAVEIHWLHRAGLPVGTGTLLEDAVAGLALPKGDGFAWAACEASIARRVRRVLVERHDHPKDWLKVASYWQRGIANVHETLSE